MILNTHPKLWATKEFHILAFGTVGEWREWMQGTVYEEPLIGGVHELMADGSMLVDAREIVKQWPGDMLICDVYAYLQDSCSPVLLVDKSPMNADHPNFVHQAIRGWSQASVIHLFRHPVPAIESLVEHRKSIMLVQGVQSMRKDKDHYEASEATWVDGNRNILDTLPNKADWLVRINYEDLVVNPEPTLRAVCEMIGIEWDEQMLNPYASDAVAKFQKAETVFVGDPKLFKRSKIEAKQADKWRKITLPVALRLDTIALAREMGYTDFPLQLPQELVWLKTPKWHDASPPHLRLLCFYPGTGVFDGLLKLVSFLPLPSLGLRLTSRSLQGCHSIAHLEHIYWQLVNNCLPLWLGGPTTDRRLFLGHSFGCRIALSFASRLDETGCTDVRVVLLDGRTLPTLSIY
jgi:hypothetical protein